jgi:hypothetical protein
VIVLSIGSAHAALLQGKTVEFTYFFPDTSSVYGPDLANGNYVVGSGLEIPNGICCGYEGTLDISDKNLLAKFHFSSSYTPASFNGFRISDVFNSIGSFTSATVNPATTLPGFTGANVSFDANNIWVNWEGLFFNDGDTVSIDIDGGSTSDKVPEPATLALFGVGLAAAGVMRRRRKTKI